MYDVIHYAKQIALHENNASKEIKCGTLNAKNPPKPNNSNFRKR